MDILTDQTRASRSASRHSSPHLSPVSRPKIAVVVNRILEELNNEPKSTEIERRTTPSDSEGQIDEDPVFGNEEGAAIHYRTMEWWHAGILMLAETVSLGVLALPQAVALLGLAPGLFLVFMLGVLATYTGYIIGQFKEKYPAMQSFADCGELIGGSINPFAAIIGREFMAGSQILILVFIMGAHILSFAIAMNAMTDHGACTIVFSVVGLAICFSLTLPRTLKAVSYCSIFSCGSVIVAVAVAMIAIGVAKPDMGRVVAVHNGLPLVKGVGPAMNICLAYAGHVAFFGFCAELKNPKDFPKALAFMQITAITFYILISSIIYYYAGPLVASPALGSASPIIRKIAFGIALPTIIIAGVVNGSVACKYIYVRMWKGTETIHQKNFKSLGSWIAICGVAWVISWAIAEAVPSFNQLLGLIAALFVSWFSYGIPGGLWLFMNKGQYFSSPRKIALTLLNIAICLLGLVMCVLGTWASAVELKNGAAGNPFSCESNWHTAIDDTAL